MKSKKNVYTQITYFLWGFILLSGMRYLIELALNLSVMHSVSEEYTIKKTLFILYTVCAASYLIFLVFFVILFRRKKISNGLKSCFYYFLLPALALLLALEYYAKGFLEQNIVSFFEDPSYTEYMSSLNIGQLFDSVEFTNSSGMGFFLLFAVILLLIGRKNQIET